MDIDKDKKHIEKLAVFDLDGTLYEVNSHIEVLNKRYGIRIFDCMVAKLVGRVFKESYLKVLYKLYERIPKEFIYKFHVDFRESAMRLLEEKRRNGYYILIVSNAPQELIEVAANRLNVQWHKAEIGRKDKVIRDNYCYKSLFVCTDNISDMNLLDIADEKVIYITSKTEDIFKQKYPKAKIMEV